MWDVRITRQASNLCRPLLPLFAALLLLHLPSRALCQNSVELLEVLESQGEFERAWRLLQRQLTTDSTFTALERPTQQVLVRTQVRLLVRMRRDDEALQVLDENVDLLDPVDRNLLIAALGLRNKEFERSLGALERIVSLPHEMRPYAMFLRAEVLHELGRREEVWKILRNIESQLLPLEMRRRLRLIEGHTALERGDFARLQELAPKLGQDARFDDRTGLLLVELARASLADSIESHAIDWLLGLLRARPTPAEAAFAFLDSLERSGRWTAKPAEHLKLAQFDITRREFVRARKRLQSQLDAPTELPRKLKAQAHIAIAGSHQKQGRHQRCLRLLQTFEPDIVGTPSEPELLRLRARSMKGLGNEKAAIAVYRDLARRFPGHPRADDALYEAGWRYEIRGEFETAEQAFGSLTSVFPRSKLADDATFRQGLSALRSGRMEDALAHFRRMMVRYPNSPLMARALYWRMWIQASLGDSVRAKALQQRLVEEYPSSYFAVLAASDSVAAMERAVAVDTTPGSAFEIAQNNHRIYMQAIYALRRTPGLEVPKSFRVASHLWRFLIDAGLAAEARGETHRLEKRFARKPGALLELLAGNYIRGAHEKLVSMSFQLSLLVRGEEQREAIEIVRYPAPFSLTLADATHRNGLSHAAVLAIMRHESAFDPRIDSRAGARGLMQLMPGVGVQVARKLGRKGMHIDELYDPETNMVLGCSLLSEELQRARGSLPQALAAYNAGSVPAARWARRIAPGEPPELYLDVAEYYETRSYLERVLGSLEVYRRLYSLP